MKKVEATIVFPVVISLEIDENESNEEIQKKLKKLGCSVLDQIRYDGGVITECSDSELIE